MATRKTRTKQPELFRGRAAHRRTKGLHTGVPPDGWRAGAGPLVEQLA